MNAEFSRKFAPEVLTNFNRGGLYLSFYVEKPDLDGFVQKLEAIENYLFSVVHCDFASSLSRKI